MYRLLTGICCIVWCAVIAFEAFGVAKGSKKATDSTKFASYFTNEFTDDVTAQIRLGGSCPAFLSEEEITQYLEGAAAVCEIYSGYGIRKKQENYGCVWELTGADMEVSYSLKYLSRENDRADKERKQNKSKQGESDTYDNDDKFESKNLISWKFFGGWSEKMQQIYQKKSALEEYSQTSSAACLELTGNWQQILTEEEIDASAKKLMAEAGASLVTVQKQDNLELYYGYGESLGEGIRFQNEKANVNLLYRVNGEQTRCILGFPAVQWDE